jgi:hypothetical protein
MTSETPVCYACGLANFKQLALQYRKTLKREDLPGKLANITKDLLTKVVHTSSRRRGRHFDQYDNPYILFICMVFV